MTEHYMLMPELDAAESYETEADQLFTSLIQQENGQAGFAEKWRLYQVFLSGALSWYDKRDSLLKRLAPDATPIDWRAAYEARKTQVDALMEKLEALFSPE